MLASPMILSVELSSIVLMTSNPLLRDIIVTNWYISRNIVASMKL